jgi:alpha-ketoglutarate-dependent taurine dioxygenase
MERDVTINARSLHPVTSVEVSGLDLRQPISEADAAELRAVFDRHALLVFREPSLDADSQRRLVEAIGPVPEPAHYISNVEPDGYRPEYALLWHSDFAFTPHPLLGISLYALEIGEGCVPTRFASTAYGAATVPVSLRTPGARVPDPRADCARTGNAGSISSLAGGVLKDLDHFGVESLGDI